MRFAAGSSPSLSPPHSPAAHGSSPIRPPLSANCASGTSTSTSVGPNDAPIKDLKVDRPHRARGRPRPRGARGRAGAAREPHRAPRRRQRGRGRRRSTISGSALLDFSRYLLALPAPPQVGPDDVRRAADAARPVHAERCRPCRPASASCFAIQSAGAYFLEAIIEIVQRLPEAPGRTADHRRVRRRRRRGVQQRIARRRSPGSSSGGRVAVGADPPEGVADTSTTASGRNARPSCTRSRRTAAARARRCYLEPVAIGGGVRVDDVAADDAASRHLLAAGILVPPTQAGGRGEAPRRAGPGVALGGPMTRRAAALGLAVALVAAGRRDSRSSAAAPTSFS